MTHIAELVETLAVQRISGEQSGKPWLQILREATFGDIGGTKSGASSGTPIPLNLGAFTIWEDITGQIASQFSSATDLRASKSPEVNLLGWWAAFSAANARGQTVLLQHEVASERLEKWVSRIREHLEAAHIWTLDIACPVCGLRRVRLGEKELEVETDAIIVEVNPPAEIVARCQNPSCEKVWTGDVEVIMLGRLVGQQIDPDKIREAKAPVEVPEYDDGSRRIEDLDLKKPEHRALLGSAKTAPRTSNVPTDRSES